LSVDPTSFLYDEIKNAKRKLEKALSVGDNVSACREAQRIAELLREYAKYKRVGSKDMLELAKEYEDLAAQLRKGESVVSNRTSEITSRVKVASSSVAREMKAEGEVAKLDAEFDAQAETLITKADVSWGDIAGLDDVKKALMEAIFFSLAKPEEPVRVEPPRRFLLYGPPGTGKTLLAMAASNMLKATFFDVSISKVLSRYVGDSPRMLSAIFRVAYHKAPSVIFFDEVEALTIKRDLGKEPATGVLQTFLTELDGFKSKYLDKPVLVIAATNKPWLLDEAILSRFEKRIYIPLPNRESRKQIFKLEIEKRGFKLQGITFDELVNLTEGYSGRDIANICKEAIMMMLRRANPNIADKLQKVKDLSELEQETYRIEPITREELLEALNRIKPAISQEEVKKYEEWGRQFGS